MNYCALDDAFQEISAPSPGCANDTASRAARKEERRKARRCKGPQASYFDIDKDRFNMSSYLSHPQPILDEKKFKMKVINEHS